MSTPAFVIVVDTETTGFGGENTCIVELGAVVISTTGQELAAFSSLVRPDPRIDREHPGVQKAMEVNGIPWHEADAAPSALEVWNAFCQWGSPFAASGEAVSPVTAFNVPFDKRIIEAEAAFGPLPWASFCILAQARRHMKTLGRKGARLSNVAEHFGIVPDGPAHRAVTDARTAAKVWFALGAQLQ